MSQILVYTVLIVSPFLVGFVLCWLLAKLIDD